MKYKIVKETSLDYGTWYVIYKRVLFFWWQYAGVNYAGSRYTSFKHAKQRVERYMGKTTRETVATY